MTWLEIAENLPQGQNTRRDCPQCGEGTNTNAAIVNHNHKYYSVFCNACDFKDYQSKGVMSLAERTKINELNEEALRVVQKIELPDDITYEPEQFSREARMWLFKAGLTPTVWRQYSIGYSARLQRVVLPIFNTDGSLKWFQCRAILKGQKPKYIQPSGNKSNILFTAGSGNFTGRVVVVEDIMSAIRVGNATTDSNTTAISLLGTKITAGQATYLSNFKECITWLDGDKAGKRGSYHVRSVVGLLTPCRNVRTDEDPKCYSNKHIREVLQ